MKNLKGMAFWGGEKEGEEKNMCVAARKACGISSEGEEETGPAMA